MITLLTDFGNQDEFTGAMKGVIYSIHPEAKIVDISHEIAPQAIQSAQYVLNGYYTLYPKGTIHLVIVDPGVGSDRNIIGIETDQFLFVAADNGLLGNIVKQEEIIKVVKIDNEKYFRNTISHTFHGRDKFAPIVAHLSSGIGLESMGTVIPAESLASFKSENQLKINKKQLVGSVIHIDRFGNLITNITKSILGDFIQINKEGETYVLIKQLSIPLKNTYAEVKTNQLLAIINSQDHLEVSENCGNASQRVKAKTGELVIIKWR